MERSHIIDIIKKLYRITLLFPKKEPLRYKMREVVNDILADFIKQEDEKEKPIDRKDSAFFLVENLDILNSYFAIAEEQKWVSSQNLLPLWQQYDDLMEYAKGLTQKIQIAPSLFLEDREDKIEPIRASELAQIPEPPMQVSVTAPVIEKEKATSSSLLVVENDNSDTLIDNPDEENEANILETANKQRQVQSVKVSPRQEKIIDFLKSNGRGQVGEFKKVFPDVTKRTLRRDFMFLLKQGIIERKGEKNNTFYTAKVA